MKAAREAIAERLVTDLGDGRYSFAHALVRDTLYDELSPPKRSALHERTGLAIEQICGGNVDERLGELAHHFLEAAPRGDLAKAIDYAQRAGAQDMEQLAYEDAVDVYGRALEVLELMERARRGAALPPPALPRRRRGQVRPGGRCPRRVRAGGRVRAAAGRHRQPGRRRHRHRADERRRSARRATARPARRGPREDRAGANRAPGRTAQREVRRDVLGRQRRPESERLVNEAIEIAREIDSPSTLAAALTRKIFIPAGPDAPAYPARDRRRDGRARGELR